MSLIFKGFLRHTTPYFMAYFGGIVFANGGGGVVKIVFKFSAHISSFSGSQTLSDVLFPLLRVLGVVGHRGFTIVLSFYSSKIQEGKPPTLLLEQDARRKPPT